MAKYGKESPGKVERETYADGVRVLESRVKDDSQRAEEKVYGRKKTSNFSGNLIGENTGRKSVGKKKPKGGNYKRHWSQVKTGKKAARKR